MTGPTAAPEVAALDPDRVGGYAYAGTDALNAAVARRLAAITAFDHAEGARVREQARPWTLAAYRPQGMLPIDVWACGFIPPPDEPNPHRPGLTRALSGGCWIPNDTPAGALWRDLLDRWNTRPRLTEVLAEHGVPAVQVDGDSGIVRRIIVVVHEQQGAERVAVWSPGVPLVDAPGVVPAAVTWFAELVRAARDRTVNGGELHAPDEVASVVVLR